MEKKIPVPKYANGMRLDVFLARVSPDLSRNKIQKKIRKKEILVNHASKIKPNYALRSGEVIIINESVEDGENGEDVEATKMDIAVVYEDENTIVVNKSPGLAVHPAKGHWNDTLINGLLDKYPKLRRVGSPVKFGLVHRLDKDTSGLVLIAKNDKALWHYSRQFELRQVEKFYIAVVSGNVGSISSGKPISISNYIGRNPRLRKQMAVVSPRKGRFAATIVCPITMFKKESSQEQWALLLVKPKTGRTHQIRVHLRSIGLPIVGDVLYGETHFKRLLLHAYAMQFKLIDGTRQFLKTELPSSFGIDFSDEIRQRIKDTISSYV